MKDEAENPELESSEVLDKSESESSRKSSEKQVPRRKSPDRDQGRKLSSDSRYDRL